MPKTRDLYDVAREVCHAHGIEWRDPRTGITYEPPTPEVCPHCAVRGCEGECKKKRRKR